MPHSYKQHLPEDGHNRRPKHVAGHAEYYTSTYQYQHLLVISYKRWRHCSTALSFIKQTQTQKVRPPLDSHADDPNNSFHILY